jgi:hypothetical protein
LNRLIAEETFQGEDDEEVAGKENKKGKGKSSVE